MAGSDGTEKWLPIPGYPAYEASSLGKIRSVQRKVERIKAKGPGTQIQNFPGKILKSIKRRGYLRVFLSVGGVHHRRLIHRLVLLTFVGPAPCGMEARHLNGDRSDCRLLNLEWGTRKQNMKDRDAHGTTSRGETNGMSKLTDEQVQEIRSLPMPWKRGLALLLAKKLGVDKRTVQYARDGQSWRHTKF